MPGIAFRSKGILTWKDLLLAASAITAVACDSPNTSQAAATDSAPSTAVEAVSETAGSTTPVPDAREPTYKDITLSPGTMLHLTLGTSVASDTSSREDRVEARVNRAIIVDDVDVVPEGSRVNGFVSSVRRAGKVKGRAQVAMAFNRLTVGDTRYDVHVSDVVRSAPSTRKQDAVKVAVPAVGGAIVGALIGGKKGAAIGAGAGGAGGTAYVLSSRGQEVRLGAGANLTVRLIEPLTIRVRSSRALSQQPTVAGKEDG